MFDYTESREDLEAIARETFAAAKKRLDQGADQSALQAGRCRAGASRSRSAQDHGRERHRSLVYQTDAQTHRAVAAARRSWRSESGRSEVRRHHAVRNLAVRTQRDSQAIDPFSYVAMYMSQPLAGDAWKVDGSSTAPRLRCPACMLGSCFLTASASRAPSRRSRGLPAATPSIVRRRAASVPGVGVWLGDASRRASRLRLRQLRRRRCAGIGMILAVLMQRGGLSRCPAIRRRTRSARRRSSEERRLALGKDLDEWLARDAAPAAVAFALHSM